MSERAIEAAFKATKGLWPAGGPQGDERDRRIRGFISAVLAAAQRVAGRVDGPMLRARKIVEDHIAAYGMVPHPDKIKEAIAADLGFVQLAATPYARDIAAGPTDEECAVICMLVSNPQNALRKDGDGWQKRVNDAIRSLRDERNALRGALKRNDREGRPAGIKTLNAEAAEGEHCDLDYRPDPAQRVVGEADASILICAVDAAITAIELGSSSAPVVECLRAARSQFLLAREALALSPGKVSVNRDDLLHILHSYRRKEIPLADEAADQITALFAGVSPGKVEGWRVPDGWKFVPVEPTDEMVKSGTNRWLPTYRNIWRAMVAAAPSPPISSRAEDS